MRSMLASAPSSATCMDAPDGMEIGRAVAEPSRQRFLDNGVHAAPERSHGDGFVRRRAGADVHDLHLVQQRLER